MRAKVALVVIAVGFGLSLSFATPAFGYATPGPNVTTSTSSIGPGGSLVVTGSNFVPNEGITLTLYSTPVTLAIPADTVPGGHTIVATGSSGDSASTAITVASAVPVAVTAPTLPFTGADIAALASVGAIALALGGMLILTGRRRRRAA